MADDHSQRELGFEPDGEAEAMLELVLIRHGHTLWNKERRYLGSTDLPLLPESGEALARLRQQPELGGSFWRVYSSDMRRCLETLAAAAPQLTEAAVQDARLREISFGEWEGLDYGQLQHNACYRRWIDDPAAVTPPGGEAWAVFTERVEQFLSGLLESAAEACRHKNSGGPPRLRVLIVTHGGVVRQLLTQISAATSFRNTAAPLPGTAVTVELLLRGGQWRFSGFPAQ